MWLRLFRKPKKEVNQETIATGLRTAKQAYEEKQEEIRYHHEALQRDLRIKYEEKIDEGRLYEKELAFQQILEEAQTGMHPLEYTIERGSVHYTKFVFFRSKQSPNPFQIIVEVHKNCVFLGVSKGKRG